jgi:hypothetical protein
MYDGAGWSRGKKVNKNKMYRLHHGISLKTWGPVFYTFLPVITGQGLGNGVVVWSISMAFD